MDISRDADESLGGMAEAFGLEQCRQHKQAVTTCERICSSRCELGVGGSGGEKKRVLLRDVGGWFEQQT